ncbi:MAG: hypothetical protein PF495_17635 [Spirochaetales bacterium]|nr:hypothetical protein [Spirochaetales bacterium]
MKELLTALKTHLRADANLGYIEDANIFITPDMDMIPITAGFPCLAIKDGAIRRIIHTNIKWEVHLTVLIIILQLLKPSDISLMGKADPKIYGVLEIADAIHVSLNEQLLGISGMEMAFSGENETETETIGYEDLVLQRKIISYEYQKTQTRP